jgi:hypothetical protein
VAIEIPVDPLVPSKIREPVYGRSNPSRSAFSMTCAEDCQQSASIYSVMSNTLLSATRSFTLPPGLRYCERTERGLDLETTTAHGYSIGSQAHLSLSKDLDSQCIAERVYPDQRCVSLGVDRPLSSRSIGCVVGRVPINPVTPSSTSSLRNSMGRGLVFSANMRSLRFLYAETTEVDAIEREKPMRMP